MNQETILSNDLKVLPPEEREDFPAQRDGAMSLRKAVDEFTVNSPETLGAANEFVLRVKKRYREIRAKYKRIVDPLEESKKETKSLFDPVLKSLAEAEKIGKGKIGAWLLAEKNRVAEEQRKARAEQERIQKEIDEKRKRDADAASEKAALETRRDAKASGMSEADSAELAGLEAEDARNKVLDEPAPVLVSKVVPPVERSFSTTAGHMGAQFEYDYELQDVAALYAAHPELVELTPRRRMILNKLKETNGAKLPGIRVTERAKISGRT